ncbi:PAS domain-containing sensor histidine kinase [Pedobacter sp. SYP-B3415]|uniref:PAS domain-containing sensor histidine kinase n=1 Tax=Pedobacter sp. SYP-B3415 TaxID=2496641 RepID=UPI0013EB5927|nr:PAS domain-containing sensor histidine kinase [Pedobacter sp. SYP-B3415]
MTVDSTDNISILKTMFDESPMPIALYTGPGLIITYANRAMHRAWNREESQIGKQLADALPELEGQPFIPILHNVIATGVAYEAREDLVGLVANGQMTYFYFDFTYKPLLNDKGEVWAVLNTATDVTNLVRTKLQLEASEQRFRNLLADAPLSMAVYEGPDIRVLIANDSMLNMWGKDESVIGLPLAEAIPDAAEQPHLSILKKVYETGEAFHIDQQQLLLGAGDEKIPFWFNFTYKPLKNPEGKVYGIVHAAVDISRLVQLQKQKDEFLGVASHELKTPVTSVKAYTQVLERILRAEGDVKKADMVGKMDRQLDRLTGLINDLLDVNKIQSGRLRFNPEYFNFDEAAIQMLDELSLSMNNHRIHIDYNADTTVFADRERIRQVIANLLNNAIKYSPGSADIWVSTAVSGQSVVVCIRDEGIGIADENKERIFEQFFRVTGDLQHTFPGLGLGLYISSEIIRTEGGKMWVDSAEGAGSSFFFSIPVRSRSGA